jgi:hypothetical protein
MFRKFFIFVICLFATSYGIVYSSSYNTTYSASTSDDIEKVYIASDQLVCSDHGIFALLEDSNGNLSKILVPQVSWDGQGLFVLAEHLPLPEADWCPRGHKACSKCGRCNVLGCPAYGCKCRR